MPFTIGLDCGTNSARALVVDYSNGREIGTAVVDYPPGNQGILLNLVDHHLARQNPADYVFALENATQLALEAARAAEPSFSNDQVISIGMAGSGSSPLPVDRSNTPLASDPRFSENSNAQCWLWKDHTSILEAAAITPTAAKLRHRRRRRRRSASRFQNRPSRDDRAEGNFLPTRPGVAPELIKGAARHQSLRDSAAIEIGLRALLEEGDITAFTTTFEDLHGIKQLPGLAVQRLMEDGYGFAGEGDWKTAALTRIMKVMAHGLSGGTSFMEDYTYHLDPANPLILGAHMLEICPSIASEIPKIEIHPLGIGGKQDPCRMVVDCGAGKAVNASIIDLGSRHRFLVNEVECVAPQKELPKLPVARVLWKPLPDLKTATAAWIYAGGAHHTVLSYALTSEHLEDFAEIAKIELSVIDDDTRLRSYKTELRQADLYFHLAQGIQG